MLPIKWFDWQMAGIPQLSGTVGALIALLDAVLVNGFNSKSVSSLTVASNVGTLEVGASHGFIVNQVIELSGANESELNSTWRVLTIAPTSITIATSGVANVTATGTITCKVAPAGWTKVFSGTNKAAYRSADIASTRLYLRVDDTTTYYSYVRGYESMSDVDNGSGLFPTTAQYANGLVWYKSSTSNSTTRPFTIIADSRLFYYCAAWNAATSSWQTAYYELNHFGDFYSYKNGDAYRCLLTGANTTGQAGIASGNSSMNFTGVLGGVPPYIARSYTGSGSAIPVIQAALILGINISSTVGRYVTPYPNLTDNGLVLVRSNWLIESATNNPIRGEQPGIMMPIQNNPLSHLDIISDVVGEPGTLLLMTICTDGSGNGRLVFDLTGPWAHSS